LLRTKPSEHLNDVGAKETKTLKIKCSICSGHGHNWLTCKDCCQYWYGTIF